MKIVTLDIESFYSKEYSLRKMTPPEYILSEQFESTGLAVKEGDAPSYWVDGDDVQRYFDQADENVMSISHNSLFDNCVFAWRYGWVPKLMCDTLGVSRAMLRKDSKSLALAKVAELLGLGEKGHNLANVIGMRNHEIKAYPDLYRRHVEYGLNDADLCYGIFKKLVIEGGFPRIELAVMDAVIRCAVEPKFKVNLNVLRASLQTIQREKENTLAQAMLLGAEGKKSLMSNDIFANLLRQHGVEPPTKISQTTGKLTYAFSKQDQDFIDLLEHPNNAIQTLVSARMGHKSTIEESRHERFIAIGQLNWPKTKRNPGGYTQAMPMPIRYAGAHTHRLSGDWKLNVQNMGRGSALRASLEAPEGYTVVAGDESQVEARFVVTLCGQEDVRLQFQLGQDVYSIFASDLFGFEVTKNNKIERFIGKQCLGADTLVLTNYGWKPITNVNHNDKVWDGLEWVSHKGLIQQGVKPTITAHGLTMTPCHEIMVDGSWVAWSGVHANPSRFQSALASVVLPFSDLNGTKERQVSRRAGNPYVVASVAGRAAWIAITSKLVGLHSATVVPRSVLALSGIGNTRMLCKTTSIELGSSIALQQPSAGAMSKPVQHTHIMEDVASKSSKAGEMIVRRSSRMSKPYQGGMTPLWRWIVRTWTRVTSQVTSGSSLTLPTWQTSDKSKSYRHTSTSLKPVFDLADAGPRHRFTIMSNEGPILVHNCILGLGFGLGPDKFTRSIPLLAWNQLKMKLEYSLEEGTHAVNLYRTKNHAVKATWKLLNTQGINALTGGGDWQWGPVLFCKEEIILPDGNKLYYKNLHQREGGRFGKEWVFEYDGMTKSLYGGKILENVVQALARIVTMQAAVRIKARLIKLGIDLALQVHDELVFVVRNEYVPVVRKLLEHELRRRPEWLPDLPLDCETGVGPDYGSAK